MATACNSQEWFARSLLLLLLRLVMCTCSAAVAPSRPPANGGGACAGCSSWRAGQRFGSAAGSGQRVAQLERQPGSKQPWRALQRGLAWTVGAQLGSAELGAAATRVMDVCSGPRRFGGVQQAGGGACHTVPGAHAAVRSCAWLDGREAAGRPAQPSSWRREAEVPPATAGLPAASCCLGPHMGSSSRLRGNSGGGQHQRGRTAGQPSLAQLWTLVHSRRSGQQAGGSYQGRQWCAHS